jgi:hypothetical protein
MYNQLFLDILVLLGPRLLTMLASPLAVERTGLNRRGTMARCGGGFNDPGENDPGVIRDTPRRLAATAAEARRAGSNEGPALRHERAEARGHRTC